MVQTQNAYRVAGGTECARTGLSEREIKILGLQYSTGLIEAYTLPRYYPGSSSVKALSEKDSARLLGVQIVGGLGSAKRIDTASSPPAWP